MRNRHLTLATLAAAMFVVACVTINVYFPEAAVKDLSERIEDAVEREAAQASESSTEDSASIDRTGATTADTTIADSATAKGHWLRSALAVAVGLAVYALTPDPAHAQSNEVAAPEISNPAIRKIIQSRAARVGELNRHKGAGAIGENNEALVEVRSLDALGLAERAALQKLIRAENADRERMFKEIAAATGTDLSKLPEIRKTYATTLREKARKGDWLQMPDGSWGQK